MYENGKVMGTAVGEGKKDQWQSSARKNQERKILHAMGNHCCKAQIGGVQNQLMLFIVGIAQ